MDDSRLDQVISQVYSKGKLTGMFDDFVFNEIVMTGPQQGREKANTALRLFGRVVQVRKEHGIGGSDMVFLRHFDGTLMAHSNQMFWKIPSKIKEEVEDLFKECEIDKPNKAYSIQNKFKRRGFIIHPSKHIK